MPLSMPESMIASRTNWLGHWTRTVIVVTPSTSSRVTTLRAPFSSGSGAPS